MRIATIIMIIIAAFLSIIAYNRGDRLLIQGLKFSGQTLLSILPLLVSAFIVAGLIQVLIPRELFSAWLGDQAGAKGIFIAAFAGGLTPGGPYVLLPLVAALYRAGMGIGPTVAYLTGWSLWAFGRLPYEIGLLGPKLTLLRFASTLIFPPIAGFIARLLFHRIA